ncbi:MAG: methyl-galactoside transport system permease protein [Clostridiales bacterium]|nr:methyl-galactoside transport system permease protein [Clostridiales bacterium]
MSKAKSIDFKSVISENILIIIVLLMVVVVSILKPNFLTLNNLSNISVNTAVRFIIALGISGCLITKGNDLSAGRTVGLGACIAGTLLQKPDYSDRFFPNLPQLNILFVLLIVILICSIFGFINGCVVSFWQVPPFIATLGMQTIVYGICLVYTKAVPLGGYRKDYTDIASGKFFGVPFLFFIAFFIGLFMWFLYNKTRHGKYMYAIGGNEVAAEVSGINVSRTKIRIYILASALFAVAGFLLGAKAGGASVNTGLSYELEAIAECTIGGVSTNGGVGKISGILVGVLVFELLKSSMQFLKIDTSWQYIVQGAVIIVAVALDLRKYLAKK